MSNDLRNKIFIGTVTALTVGGISLVPAMAATNASKTHALCSAAAERGQLTTADKTWAEQCQRVLAEGARVLASPTTPGLPSASPSPTATPTSSSGWPLAATTGVPPFAVLSAWSGSCDLRTANQVIENKVFNCQVNIYAKNVVIRNSAINNPNGWGLYTRAGGSSTLTRLTVRSGAAGCNTDAGVTGQDYIITNSKVEGFGDGFYIQGPNVFIKDNYAKMCTAPGGHSDGIQGAHAGRNVHIIHNHIDQRLESDVTANVFWGDDSASGLNVKNNLFRGGGHTIRIHSADGHTVSGNVVQRGSYLFSPVSSRCQGITWTNNKLADVTEDGILSNVTPLACSGNA